MWKDYQSFDNSERSKDAKRPSEATCSNARLLARQYAKELLVDQDTPDWAQHHGIISHEDASEFMDELERIAKRI